MTNVADRQRVSPSQARFAERARRRRRRAWLRLLLAALLVALLAGGVWVVGWSSALTVTSVRVEGVSGEEAAAIHDIGELSSGTPLARVDTGAVARQVKARRAIAEASVSRSWPHTLVITAVHRTPALVLQMSNGQLEVVDSSGVRYAEVDSRPDGVPVVTAATSAPISDEAVAAALSVVRALPSGLDEKVSGLSVSSAGLVTFQYDATEVVWGSAGQEKLKVRIIQALLRSKPTPKVIDVSAPDTPVSR